MIKWIIILISLLIVFTTITNSMNSITLNSRLWIQQHYTFCPLVTNITNYCFCAMVSMIWLSRSLWTKITSCKGGQSKCPSHDLDSPRQGSLSCIFHPHGSGVVLLVSLVPHFLFARLRLAARNAQLDDLKHLYQTVLQTERRWQRCRERCRIIHPSAPQSSQKIYTVRPSS